MIFQQIRNATVRLKYDGCTFMIDPWLDDICPSEEREEALKTRRFLARPMVSLPFAAEEIIKDTDICIVSHTHGDHFSAAYIPKDMRMLFQNRTDEEYGRQLGFVNTDSFKEETLIIHDIRITRTPGRHGDTDLMAEKAGPVSGFLFEKEDEKTIWIAGDTVFYEEIPKIIQKYRPDVIVVNACGARVRSGRLIMNAEDVIKTCASAPDSIIIASHMDTVSHAHLSRKELAEQLENTPYASQVLIPLDGEEIIF